MSEERDILVASPLMYQILRLLESTEGNLAEKEIIIELKKTKGSTGRALYHLKRMGLIEAKRNPEDGRSMTFGVRKKGLVRNLLAQVASAQYPPRPFKAIPFAMADLKNVVAQGLGAAMVEWKIARGPASKSFDLTLERTNPPLQLGLELKLGGEHFERRLFETIGQIAVPDPPDLVVLAIFGAVRKKFRDIVEERLTSLLAAQKSAVRFLWLDRGPLAVDRAYVAQQIAKPILEWTNQMRGRGSS
jgi:DNA-binding MarR family transcriptional regulator